MKEEIKAVETSDEKYFENQSEIVRAITTYKMSILTGLAVTRFKTKLDSNNYDELIRKFLFNRSFFFTLDKLLTATNKAFHTVVNDEYSKSSAFELLEKYNSGKHRLTEYLYLEEYKSNLHYMSSTNGFTIRMLYSPISRLMSVHFFTIGHPFSQFSLVEDLKHYRTKFTTFSASTQLYSDELPIPTPKVYLKRNLKAARKALEEKAEQDEAKELAQNPIHMEQNLTINFYKSSNFEIGYTASGDKTEVSQIKRKRKN